MKWAALLGARWGGGRAKRQTPLVTGHSGSGLSHKHQNAEQRPGFLPTTLQGLG